MQRTIHGPEQEHLTADECAAWLGVGMTLFKQLVKAGDFPPPLRMGTRKCSVGRGWTWWLTAGCDPGWPLPTPDGGRERF